MHAGRRVAEVAVGIAVAIGPMASGYVAGRVGLVDGAVGAVICSGGKLASEAISGNVGALLTELSGRNKVSMQSKLGR